MQEQGLKPCFCFYKNMIIYEYKLLYDFNHSGLNIISIEYNLPFCFVVSSFFIDYVFRTEEIR